MKTPRKSGPTSARKVPRAAPQAAGNAASRAGARDASWVERLERTSLCGTVALLVATPLIPSEAVAQQGTGAVLVMLWFLLLPTWLLCRLAATQRWLRLDATSAAVFVFLALHTLSGLVCLSAGNGRYALNVTWQWLSFGAAFFLVRQTLVSPRQIRALLAVLVGLAVTLSAHGVYQYFVVMPQNRADYQRDPEETLRRIGVVAPPGSLERKQLEDRLFSVEPTSTFALTNSLASFLSPLLILTAGIAIANATRLRTDRAMLAAVLGTCLIVGACLLLTKSRTAFLATIAGAVMLPVLRGSRLRLAGWQLLAVAGLLLAMLLAGAIATGGLDLKVLSEAPKSVLYRLEYWQATMHMIADHPWLGCGPGNFQTCYTAYKLPQASETVADPHNFLLEIWATAGSVTFLAFLGIFVAAVAQTRVPGDSPQPAPAESLKSAERRKPTAPTGSPAGGSARDSAGSSADQRAGRGVDGAAVYLGAILGVLLAYPSGWLVGFPVEGIVLPLALTVGAGTVALLHGWVHQGELPTWPLVAALGVLLLNLLAAGGIGFPGVAQTGWVLLACILNLRGRSIEWTPSRVASGAILLPVLSLPVLCFLTLYRPILQSQADLNQANQLRSRGQFEAAADALAVAAQSDPYSSAPWLNLAQLDYEQLRAGRDERLLRRFQEATDQARRRDPHSSALMTRIGHWYLNLHLADPSSVDIQNALQSYQRAMERYPLGNMEWAQLAWTHYLAGDWQQAGHAASEALRLDALVPHQERKLSQRTLVGDTGQVIAATPPGTDNEPQTTQSVPPTAEQRMRELRKLADTGGS